MTTPAYLQRVKAATTSATNAQTASWETGPVALNSLRVVFLRVSGATDHMINPGSGLSGSISGAYAQAVASISNAAATQRLYAFYKEGGAAGTETLTCTTDTTGNSMRWGGSEHSGVLAAASPDGTPLSARYTATTTPASGSLITSASNSLLVGCLSADSDVTTIVAGGAETARWTDGVSGNRHEGQDIIETSAGTYTMSWVTGASAAGVYILLAFKADTGGGLPTPGPQQYQQRRSTIITL